MSGTAVRVVAVVLLVVGLPAISVAGLHALLPGAPAAPPWTPQGFGGIALTGADRPDSYAARRPARPARAAAAVVAPSSWQAPPAGQGAAWQPAVQPAPPAALNWLWGPHGLSTAVGRYGDCSGSSPVPRDRAVLDLCMKNLYYFAGHNPGVFTPLISTQIGDVFSWHDSAGRLHRFRVIAIRTVDAYNPPAPVRRDVVAQFQTCIRDDGSLDRVLDAVAA